MEPSYWDPNIFFNLTAFCGTADMTPWDADKLNFGLCFQKSLLVVPTYAFLAIASAFYMGRQSEWVVRRRGHLAWIHLRMVASAISLIIAILEPILIYFVANGDIYWADGLMTSVMVFSLLVHLGYLASLRNRLSVGTRGPRLVVCAWIFTLLAMVNLARTAMYAEPEMGGKILQVWKAIVCSQMAIQFLYFLTLCPKGSAGVSQYQQLHHHQATESTPLLHHAPYHDYSGFHEAVDPYHLGVAEERVNILSFLTFHWVNSLIENGSNGQLKTWDDLHDLPMELRTDVIAHQVDKTIMLSRPLEGEADPKVASSSSTSSSSSRLRTKQPKSLKPQSLLRILHKCFGVRFYLIGLLKLAGDLLGFAGPLLLHALVTYIEEKEENMNKGLLIAFGLCFAALIATFCSIHFNYQMAKVNLRMRAGIISSVYRKVLHVSWATLSTFSSGQVVNMMSTDTDRIVNACQSFHALWSLPVQLIITLYLLYQQIGISFLAGVGITLLMIPINKLLATKIGGLSETMMKYKDNRVGLMNEVLANIKLVKLNAWETTFKERIYDERYGEVKALAGRKYLDAACVYFWATTPVLIPIVTFSVYIALGNPLNAASVFTAVALFNMLVMPLNAFPWVINGIVEAWVSLKRVQKLMNQEDQDLMSYYTVVPEMSQRDSDLQVLVSKGAFTWSDVGKEAEDGDAEGAIRGSSHSLEGAVGGDIEVEIRGRREGRNGRKGGEGAVGGREIEVEIHGRREMSGRNGKKKGGARNDGTAPLLSDSPEDSLDGEDFAILPTLRNMNIQISHGQVVGIIGKVGSGKTSLLNAILGEMTKFRGVVAVASLHTGFGLATQKTWIQNTSIQNNILFGSSLDITRYRRVLWACALDEDLSSMPLKDNTRCGENGAALSGGQKARVSLARAVYQNKSIYLLDDILSSVDAPVARHIMKNCIHGILNGKTVIMTTSSVSLLTRANWVISVKNGGIERQGPPESILPSLISPEELNGDWWHDTESLGSLDGVGSSPGRASRRMSMDVLGSAVKSSQNPPDNEEEREYGEVSLGVLWTYGSAVGVPLAFGIFVAFVLMQLSRNLTDMWLANWVSHVTATNVTPGVILQQENYEGTMWLYTGMGSNPQFIPTHPADMPKWIDATFLAAQSFPENESGPDNSTKFYLIVYIILAISNSFFTLIRAFLFAYGGLQAAKSLHRRLLDSVLHAKISFFDNNPLGRLLNRFSTDMFMVDDSLPFQMNIFYAQVFGLVGSICVTMYGLPWIGLLYMPLGLIYFNLQVYYRKSSRDLKRLHATSLSPLYEHIAETLQGLTIIRGMRAVHRFISRADSLVDVSQRAQFDIQAASQWLNLRLQLIGLAMLTGVSGLALAEHHFGTVDPGMVGLVISYALTVSNFLNSVVTSLTETERELISVERINQYLKGAHPEKCDGTLVPPFGWVSHGSIRFHNAYLKYQDHNPYALRKVSFEVAASEKVGIIGRTGAGKSSIFLALFRLVELTRGQIFVDNVDISKLTLKKLRSSMAIVTQDTFLFSGTIRENLDPHAECVDSQIWQALENCHLLSMIHNLGGLEAKLDEGGRSLSAGERQLFCLARALLCRTKIVCIDEGTSQLDHDTDEQIQQTIRSAFRNKTLIIIAHRVHTVRDCDKIVVMSEGEVLECGRPSELLSDKQSHFYSILQSQ